MRPSELQINEQEMTILKRPMNDRQTKMMFSVSPSKMLRVNGCLKQALEMEDDNRNVIIRVQKDYKVILIRKTDLDDADVIAFNKDWSKKYSYFAEELKEQGYDLPAKYLVEWNEKSQGYVGILQEVPEIGDVKALVKKVQEKRRTYGRKK